MKRKFFLRHFVMFLIPLLIPFLVLSPLIIFTTQKYVKEEVEKSNTNILRQANANVELILSSLDDLSLNFDEYSENSQVLLEALRTVKGKTDYDILKTHSILRNLLRNFVSSKPYVHSVYVYYKNDFGQFFSNSMGVTTLEESTDKSWYQSFINKNTDIKVWTESRKISIFEDDPIPTEVTTIYKRFNNVTGVLVLNIRNSYIINLLNSFSTSPDQLILISDNVNKVLFHTVPSSAKYDYTSIISNDGSLSEEISNTGYSVDILNSSRYGWNFISIIPSNSLYKIPIMLSKVTFYLLIISLSASLLLAYYLTKHNYRNLTNIVSIFESAESGKSLPALPDRVKDEYGFIMQNIVKTFVEQNYLKVQKQASELLALQTQISPHFLFNTLNSIYWEVIALTSKPNKVNDMILNLSKILEYCLSDPSSIVTFSEEIDNTQSYIEIQKNRYKDKFNLVWQYDESIKSYPVVKLLLQPLIENSIYHGIKEKEKPGLIKIKIKVYESDIKISIIDNGIGITRERLKEIRETLENDREFSGHIGLFNTHKRLKLKYGNNSRMEIRSKHGCGTAIYIYIPKN